MLERTLVMHVHNTSWIYPTKICSLWISFVHSLKYVSSVPLRAVHFLPYWKSSCMDIVDFARPSSDASNNLVLRGGLGEVLESLAALELGILDDA